VRQSTASQISARLRLEIQTLVCRLRLERKDSIEAYANLVWPQTADRGPQAADPEHVPHTSTLRLFDIETPVCSLQPEKEQRLSAALGLSPIWPRTADRRLIR
jgi:hypothetical protein